MIRKITLACLVVFGQLSFAGTIEQSNASVGCENQTLCFAHQKVAVGYYLNVNNNLSPLGYTSANGGATWSIGGGFPLSSDVAANGVQNSKLQDLSCDSTARVCSAVGFYLNSNNNIAPLSYVSVNGGVSWSVSPSLTLPGDVVANGAQNSELLNIACDSSGRFCKAGGYYRNLGNNIAPLSYSSANGGVSWSLSPVLPLPGDVAANGIQNSRLQDMSCDNTSRFCTAVGSYLSFNNNIVPLSYIMPNGATSWSLSAPLPLPGNVAANGVQNSSLQAVACDSTGHFCKAVGYYLSVNNNIVPLSYTSANGGAIWSLSAIVPLPGDVAANGIQTSKLQDMACDSTGRLCSAVGFYRNRNNNLVPLSYITANGGLSWSFSGSLPLPVDVAAMGIQNSELEGVTCDSTGVYCNAMGFYLNSSNNKAPLSYFSVNGGVTWVLNTLFSLPGDVATLGSQNSVLLSVV